MIYSTVSVISIVLGYPSPFPITAQTLRTTAGQFCLIQGKTFSWLFILNTPFYSSSLLLPSLSATTLMDLQLLPLKPEVWLKQYLPQLMSLLAYPCYDSRGIDACSISRNHWLPAFIIDHIGLVLTFKII